MTPFLILALSHLLAVAAASTGQFEYPWQDPSLPTARRTENLVSLLTVAEKASLLQATSPAVPRLSLPGYRWARECERGDASGHVGTAYVVDRCVLCVLYVGVWSVAQWEWGGKWQWQWPVAVACGRETRIPNPHVLLPHMQVPDGPRPGGVVRPGASLRCSGTNGY